MSILRAATVQRDKMLRGMTVDLYRGVAHEKGIGIEQIEEVFDVIDMNELTLRCHYSSDIVSLIHDEMARGLTAIIDQRQAERAASERLSEADRLWGVLS